MTEIRKRLTYGAVAILCAVGIAGCSTPKNVTYFQDATPEAIITASQAQPFKAKPGDKIIISDTEHYSNKNKLKIKWE